MSDISNNSDWVEGRVGMLYRVLSTGLSRQEPPEGGTQNDVVVSHIRLPFDGEVPDYVHYHKVEFQVIYCLKGRIRVVYEDQGPPFWLEPGDAVLQPPEIRHRVLESTGNAEVIEVTMPASHETCADHDLPLPTAELHPNRIFGTQRFVRLRGAKSSLPETSFSETMAGICQNLPRNESITATIQHVIPLIQKYLASDRRLETS